RWRRKSHWGSVVSLMMMKDSLRSHNSNQRKKASSHAAPSSRSAAARHDNRLSSGRHRSLLAKMPTPNAKKRRVNRVKGFASRGRTGKKGVASRGLGKKWILILLVVLLFIPAMQVAVVRFINPPWTLPMLIGQSGAMFSSTPKPPLRYRWIALPQIPEMFLEHLWISEDQRFFQLEGFDWKEMDLALKKAERKVKPLRGASTITNQCARSIYRWQGRSWIR